MDPSAALKIMRAGKMVRFQGFCIAALVVQSLAAPTEQIPIHQDLHHGGQVPIEQATKQRPLHGRFLQVTDFHPDPYYQIYSSTSEDGACHRGQGPAGLYGAETSECDSPISLINETMRWIELEFKDNVDFVIWTGDSARHDNDEDIPRTHNGVRELNQFMVHKMSEVFGKHNGDEDDENPNNDFVIPIVPTFGNNDILPHNIMVRGPNLWTRAYTKIWRQFIPEAQRHSFEQGGWFYVEVIPHKLAVFSLNTMYFFDSNAAVDGCADRHEPGYQHMEWLRIQLQFMRERGMKAMLIGHVPPARNSAKRQWDETCWQKYALWMRQYRDVIVSTHYGHMNYDHFMLQDFKDLDEDTKNGRMPSYQAESSDDDDDEVHDLLSSDYFIELRNMWSKLPKPPKTLDWPSSEATSMRSADIGPTKKSKKSKKDKKRDQDRRKKFLRKVGGPYAERYAASFVAASVVPNLYPTLRVFEYNTTGLTHAGFNPDAQPWAPMTENLELSEVDQRSSWTDMLRKKRKKGRKKYKFKIPDPPSKSAPPGPAYSPQTLSLLKYTQYLANLTHINNDFTGAADTEADRHGEVDTLKWHEGKHSGKKPHGKDHIPKPKKFKYEVHYDTQDDDVYQLKDLTMPNLVDLARRIGDFKTLHAAYGDDIEFCEEGEADCEEGEVPYIWDAEEEKNDEPVRFLYRKKKHHKHGKHNTRNQAWYTFIRRAFVETLEPEDIEEQFGH